MSAPITREFPYFPAAWLGYRDLSTPREKKFGIAICAWCPDKDEAEAMAKAEGFNVTHGCCESCSQKQIAALLGEKE
jgi:hypothetical protein